MIKYTEDELKDILEKHAKWLKNDEGGCRANLDRTDLRGARLNGANLRGARLNGANLRGASLVQANLYGAELYKANLEKADLMGAKLENADLRGASFTGANLERAIFTRANLEQAIFTRANLKGASLIDAMLHGACLNSAIMSPDTHINFPLACPDEGAFIGWKKCVTFRPLLSHGNCVEPRYPESVIVKLCILNTAKRSSATTRKCRCDRAEVLDIQDMHGNCLADVVAYSYYDRGFTYEVGKVVSVDDFDEYRWHECTSGIHFFITKQEAIEYNNGIKII